MDLSKHYDLQELNLNGMHIGLQTITSTVFPTDDPLLRLSSPPPTYGCFAYGTYAQ